MQKFAIGLIMALCALMTSASAEARSHVSFGFGVTHVHQPMMVPVITRDYYPCYEEVVHERVWVDSRPYYREVYVRPVYRPVIIEQRPSFSFGFWN